MKIQVTAAVVALSVVFATGTAFAQSQASSNAKKYGVAVIDINYIFKNHQKFRDSMDGMKGNFQAVDTELKGQQQKIIAAEEQKQQFKPGTPDFKRLDEQVVKMKAGLQVEVTQKRKALVEQEAKIYYDTYVEVGEAIKYYAERQGIGLVLRFNGDDADPLNRESILRSINKAVHFQNRIDITPDVLSLLNRSGTQQATRPAQPARR